MLSSVTPRLLDFYRRLSKINEEMVDLDQRTNRPNGGVCTSIKTLADIRLAAMTYALTDLLALFEFGEWEFMLSKAHAEPGALKIPQVKK